MDQVAQIREKTDIISLISEYIPLKKLGRNFKTNCPFHNEKTPSFVVSPERQIWHCFGCHKGGDAYSFLMEYENLEFPEALRILAKRAGIELEERSFESGLSSKKDKIYLLNRQAMEFYHYLLISHNVGKKALDYLLNRRKIKPQTIDTFKLGFAPRVGNSLSNYLIIKKKQKKEDLVDAGLASFQNGRVVDFFANRTMFPLFDHRDNIIGFSGRIMDDNPPTALSKYVNTRETLVYHKGNVFFGLNIAKNKIKEENTAIVMEGEFDVISSFEEGISNAIAVKGTALTEEQVSLLSRFTEKVILCFDQDTAGQNAIKRSLSALEKKGLTTKVVTISDGKDPDEAIKKDPISFKKAIKNSTNIYDFLISKATENYGKNTIESKKKISDELLPILSSIENEIIKEHYLKKIAQELDTSYESIIRQIERISKKEENISFKKEIKDKRPREEILEEYVLALILQSSDPSESIKITKEILSEFSFKVPAFNKILYYLINYLEGSGGKLENNKFLTLLPKELLVSYDVCYLLPLPQFQDQEKHKEEIEKVSKELKTLYLHARIKEISTKIKHKEQNLEQKEEDLLHEELSRLFSLLKNS